MNLFGIIIELILFVQLSQSSELTVNTTYGSLIGREFKTRNNRTVASFNGIPFAKPPLNELRFQDPQPPEPWTGVREAYNFGSVCVQIPYDYPPVSTTKMGNEDCLYLSVYSPNLKPTNLLPVLVYIHGGPFYSGSGEIDKSPEFFLDYDIVVVMPNYRLGVLGFLATEDNIMPGNLGLKDQVMALNWIQDNIANFGGDSNQITLIGDTAGAACVSLHMYSPMSRGLFHKAISQSGTAFAPWTKTPPGVARSRAIQMAQLFDCPSDSSEAILDCLQTKNAYSLTETYSKFMAFQEDPLIIFTPICDRNATNPFLPFNPHGAEPAPVPWIVGVTSLVDLVRTGVFVREPETLIEYNQQFDLIAPVSLYYDNTSTSPEKVTKEVREFYFDDQPITMELFRNLTDMYSDRMFIWPAVEALRVHKGPHYFYYFDYLGEHSYQEIFAGKRVLVGSADLDDLIYIWKIKNPFEVGEPTTSQDLNISHLLLNLIYNFMSSGDPTPAGFDFEWPQWDNEQQNFISFGNNGEVTVNSTLLPSRISQSCELTVNTTGGSLIGREFKSRNNRTVAAFNGIPFAKPPLNELRFQDPQPPEPWIGVREAYNFGSVCVQIPYNFPQVNTTKMGNEDCLYLSVYSPNLKPINLLPVLVYIHGVTFYAGSGEIDKSPKYFLDYDIVVVMPNYRLGVLGFLTLEDDVMPGNLGLKDQVMALKWIQDNIANFGGDSNQITLIGDFAGAASISFHMYSPMSRGLFHKAISQSGTALDPWTKTPPGVARSRAIKMAQLFDCPTDSSEAILDCLRTKNAYSLIEAYSEFKAFQEDPLIIFTPICDRNAANPFLPFNPYNAKPAPVPWIVGVPSLVDFVRTAVFVREPETLIEYNQQFDQIAPIFLYYDNTAPNPEEVTKEIREFYFDDQPITMELLRNLTEMYSDRIFIWPAVEALRVHEGPHYFYYFDYVGEYSFQEIFAGKRVLVGSVDLDDVLYIWKIKNPFEVGEPTTSQDLNISHLLLNLIYNFISSGDPTPSGFDFEWPQWDNEQQNFISFGNNGEVTVNSRLLPSRISQSSELTVNTTCGSLVGREFKSRNGRIVAAFNGIPFAKPPLNELRFQDPQPPEPWVGVREAYNFGSVCVQIAYDFPLINTTKMGNEDCLYLSVYSPNLKPTNLLPVLVNIHGGPFYSGSGEIDKSPEYFLDYDIVVVMPNYRLGVLGFMTMEDDIIPGNLGLKDQVMALKWIQDNIANFGGDSNQITLIGDTAGAASVSFHMYSPMSRGLFHKAISQQGTALDPWPKTPPGVARSRAIQMAQLFDCPTDSSEAILDCLQTKNAYSLIEAYLEFRVFQVDPLVIFTPICDRNSANPFLPFNPNNAEPAPVPWIVGVNSLAGFLRTAVFAHEPETLIEFDQQFDQVAPISLYYEYTATNPEKVSEEVREFYFDDQPITMELLRNLSNMYADRVFIWSAVQALRVHKGPHYFYYFDYLGEYSYQELLAGKRVLVGSVDFDDTIYIWKIKNPFEIGELTRSQDLNISHLLLNLFYNFISSGEPTPPGFDFEWPQWDNEQQNFISFGNSGEVTVNSTFLPSRIQFWSQLHFNKQIIECC